MPKLQNNPRRSKKKPTPAQLRARAMFAKRFGGKRVKRKAGRRLAENAAPVAAAPKLKANRRRTRRADALQENRRRRRTRRAASSLQENAQVEENPMAGYEEEELSENPRGRRRKKKRGGKRRRKARRRNRQARTFAEAFAGRAAPKRRRRRTTRKAKRRSSSRRRSPRRRATRRSHSRSRSRVAKAHIVRLPATKSAQVQVIEVTRRRRGASKRRRKGGSRRRRSSRGRRRSRAMLMENPSFFSGHGPPVLYENAEGAFTGASLRAYAVAAFGVGLGLVVADVTDRFIATRKPKDGKNPWYGKDAAAVYRSRPDAWRMAGQAGGAVIGIAGAYMARGRGVIPYALTGIAVGFGANLMKMLWDWYAAPAIFKVGPNDWGKPSMGSRLYPLEQASIQDTVSQLIAKWQTTPSLQPGQQTPPVISPPMAAGGSLYALGRPNMQAVGNGQNARVFKSTGRLGNCTMCGGHNGCYSDCPTQCPNCPEYNNNTECRHQVQAGEDLSALAASAGVTVDQISAMNGGGDPSSYWQPGNVVRLPYGACLAIEKGNFVPVQPPTDQPVVLTDGNTPPIVTYQDTGPIIPTPVPASVVAGVPGFGTVDQEMIKRSLTMAGAGRGA